MESNNLAYFTLDEDSDVEEYVADDPNFKKKIFWYDLVEKTISSASRRNLIIHAIISLFGVFLQWKYFMVLFAQGRWQYLAWTIVVLALSGSINLYMSFTRRNKDADTTVPNRHFTIRMKYFILIMRQISSFCLLVPIYNLIYYWTESSRNERNLRRPLVMRSQPQPTKLEIMSVQKVLEGVLEKSYLLLIEAFLKFVPFTLLQICILVHHKDLNMYEDSQILEGVISYLILWGLLEISLACVLHANAQFNYTKSLQFQDMRETGASIHLTRTSILDSVFHLVNNFFSAAFRVYCIALLFATVTYWVIPFIFVLYLTFYSIVLCMPTRSRLRFENPPKGLSTTRSDLISRGMNFFCNANIKQECFIHFTYLFTLLFFIQRIYYVATQWSIVDEHDIEGRNYATTDDALNNSTEFDSSEDPGSGSSFQDLDDIDSVDWSNFTRMELVRNCTLPEMSVPIPIFDYLNRFLTRVVIYLMKNCSSQRKLLQDDLAVIILLAAHYTVSLLYLAKARTRILFESEFPAQIAQKYWTQWMTKEWDFNDIFEVKKILLCMVMSDSDLSALANKTELWKCIKNSSGPTARESLLSFLWDKYVEKTNIISVSQERLEQTLERRKKLRNVSKCDEALNHFLEFLWDNFVLEEDTIRMVLYSLDTFDESIVNSNSLRLTHIEKVLNFKESIWK